MIYDFIDRSLGVIEEVLNTNVLLLKPKFQENERGEPYKTIVGFFLMIIYWSKKIFIFM